MFVDAVRTQSDRVGLSKLKILGLHSHRLVAMYSISISIYSVHVSLKRRAEVFYVLRVTHNRTVPLSPLMRVSIPGLDAIELCAYGI